MPSARSFRSIAATMFVLAGSLFLGGCGTAPTTGEPAPRDGDTAYRQGAYEQAALAWQSEAMQAAPGEAGPVWVSAADAWMRAGRPGKAEEALRWVDRKSLSAGDAARLDLVLADLALRNGRLDEAEILLQKAGVSIPGLSQSRYDDLYARLIRALSGPAAREVAQAAAMIEGMRYYNPEEAVGLVRALEPVSSGELAIRAYNPRAERQLTGWLDLTLTIRGNLVDPEEVSGAMSRWKARHPHHLLNESQALDTWLHYRQIFRPPERVAVILPESGGLQAAGQAIRDGLMNAYADQPGGSEILFFGTDDDPQSTVAAYFSALDAHVERIIGPLRRESVEALLGVTGLSTPVLALNDLPSDFAATAGLADQIRGLSLSQDAEARAIAVHAAESGFERALLIAPESAWGERMAAAFEEEFLHGDRQIVTALRYLETENDHGAVLQRALKIDESKARKRRLENTLQTRLEFEPVRRDDLDMIFMAANTTQARLIRPQLRFHEAGDIPVYATGRIYSGQPDPARNRDLDGIRFPATRWQLEHTERDEVPEVQSLRGGSLSSLFALGQDAWNLLPWLELMNKDPGFRFPGQSGNYYDLRQGTLQRRPNWAVFRNGRPAPLKSDTPRGGSH